MKVRYESLGIIRTKSVGNLWYEQCSRKATGYIRLSVMNHTKE